MQAKIPPNSIRGTILTVHYFVDPADEAAITKDHIPQAIAFAAAAAHVGHRAAAKAGHKPTELSIYVAKRVDSDSSASLVYEVLDPSNGAYIASVQVWDLAKPAEQVSANARIYLRSE